jgi:hypothetical protein
VTDLTGLANVQLKCARTVDRDRANLTLGLNRRHGATHPQPVAGKTDDDLETMVIG